MTSPIFIQLTVKCPSNKMDNTNKMDNKGSIKAVITVFSERTSIHGFGWFQKTHNCFLRAIMILIYFIIFTTLLSLIGVQLRDMIVNPKISSSISHEIVLEAKYPVITVCHPGFFHNELLESM